MASPADELQALKRRVAKLERMVAPGGILAQALGDCLRIRFEEIERRQLRFFGVHEPGRSYRANSLVVRKGGLWIALRDTTMVPGTGADWQLAVKSGEANREPVAA